MKKKKVIIITAAVVILIGISIFIYRYESKPNGYYWRSVLIERGDVNVLVTATGAMAADTSVDVGVQVSGTIAKIKVDFNDVVKKGQVIAILDTTLFSASKLNAVAALQRTQVAAEEAKLEMDRTKNLLDQNLVAHADYDLLLTAYKNAQGNVISAQAQLKTANINLKYCTITAPISGIVISRNVQVGNMVIASFNSPVLFTIANDLTKMQVQTDVDEADIGLIKIGQKAKFTVDTYPSDVFTGVVTQIRHQPVMVQNVVNYVVIIEVSNPDLKLMPGLTANSNIYIQESKNVLKIPTNAFAFVPPVKYIQDNILLPDSVKKLWLQKLRQTGELKKKQIVESNNTTGYLWVIKDKDIFPIQVTKGLNDGSFTEISGDIQEGYEIAIGINDTPTAPSAKATQNPFLPKFPSGKK